MKLDDITRHAIKHTYHCLIGCGFGEILGMLIASSLHWHKIERIVLAILLAFFFGYLFTYRGVRKESESAKKAISTTLATDTVSITSMEIIDTIIELLIPNALIVTPTSFRFWWGLAVALLIAFIVTVPVNRYMISRHPVHSH
ncbi:MAG TPA: DUF4396 domain-containing protein [Patescibacteria group bacterium]|nr:DUF4396 domain-containing protein [Patescibacteria group bacterium]